MCHMSGVTCQVSDVRCQVSHAIFFDKVAELVGGGSVINEAYPVYLFFIFLFLFFLNKLHNSKPAIIILTFSIYLKD